MGDPSDGGNPEAAQQGEADPENAKPSSDDAEPSGDSESQEGEGAESGQEHEGSKGGHDGVDPADGEGEPSESEANGDGSTPVEDAEAVSRQAAHDLLDDFEEGRPRIYISGGSGDRPW